MLPNIWGISVFYIPPQRAGKLLLAGMWEEEEALHPLQCECVCGWQCRVCARAHVHICAWIFISHCFESVLHKGTLTQTYDKLTTTPERTTTMPNDSKAGKSRDSSIYVAIYAHGYPYCVSVEAHILCTHVHMCSHTRLHKSMCWILVSVACISCEGFTGDSSEHSRGFLSSRNTRGAESA